MKAFSLVVGLMFVLRDSDAYSVDICMDACRNLQDKASADLCEQCAANMPLDYSMCTSACGHIDETYNRWLDNVYTMFLPQTPYNDICLSDCM